MQVLLKNLLNIQKVSQRNRSRYQVNLKTCGTVSSPTQAVVQSESRVFGTFDALAANSAVITGTCLFTFAGCHAGSAEVCHSC